jgi:CDP-4-dehydro-6-deoxyglucose reductase
MHTISTTTGKQFSIQAKETLLDAALRQGIVLEYSCRTGRCSTCKGRVISGSTVAAHEELGLTPAERNAGWILTCVREAIGDATLAIDDLGEVRLFPAKTLPCRIQSIERLASDVVRVMLRTPPTSSFDYHSGQYIDVIGPGGVRRSYSVANAPGADKLIELHVREVPGGVMSRYWFSQAKQNDLLRLNGPLGTFFLRDITDKDLVFLATGTGIAPVKAMLVTLSTMESQHQPRSVTVYWGGRLPQDLYWRPSDIKVDHRFETVLSRATDEWKGRRGHVQRALLADKPELQNSVVYACGSDAMIHSASELLQQAGLPPRAFHSDAFVCSASA